MKTSIVGQIERIERKEIAARVRGERLSQVNEHFGESAPRKLNAHQRRRKKRHFKEEMAHVVKAGMLELRHNPEPLQVSWLE